MEGYHGPTLRAKRNRWLVARLLAGLPVSSDEPLDVLQQRLADRPLDARIEAWRLAVADTPNEEEIEQEILRIDPNSPDPSAVATGEDLVKEVGGVDWICDRWLPKQFLTILAGPPGVGKSALALGGFVKPITENEMWPWGDADGPPLGRVMWVEAEQAYSILAARIDAYGVTPNRVLLHDSNPFGPIRLSDSEWVSDFRERVQIHQPSLVVVDSFRGTHAGDENKSEVVQPLLDALTEVARLANIPVLLVHHLGKRGEDRNALDRLRGSSAIGAMGRVIIGIDRPDRDSEWCRVAVIKSNFAKPEPFGFLIGDNGLEFGEPPEESGPRTKRDEAVAFLREQLEAGPKRQTEIEAAAAEKGLSSTTLKRAKREAGIQSKQMEGAWWWSLPARS